VSPKDETQTSTDTTDLEERNFLDWSHWHPCSLVSALPAPCPPTTTSRLLPWGNFDHHLLHPPTQRRADARGFEDTHVDIVDTSSGSRTVSSGREDIG